ncbi:VIT domain-containing protein [Anatilimnocola floriformis]|uniref:VIT domain-containing protein n=1 Tax=Anatilimnocola floriformis TaxID=2948575 RepID=UPI0020C27901|nr:VIT domain-containing protein [Anatilimnocola floriformis]
MLFLRTISTALATAAVFSALWFSHNPRGGRSTGPEWAALDRPALADKPIMSAFAHLQNFDAEIDGTGGTQKISGAENGLLRFDAEPGRYSIVQRNLAWHVDEAANRAESKPATYFYRRDEAAALNPWQLLGIQPETGAAAGYREEETNQNNSPLLASYFNAHYRGQAVAVEARVDPVKNLPRDLTIWPRANRGAQPLLRFQLTQAGGAADATKFKIAESLTEDGRIGKIVDLQGLVSVRALASARWTPLSNQALLVPGDWLRTDNRGANAATVQLAPQTKMIVGPGTTVELPKPDQLRVSTGIVQIAASEKSPITLTGPDGGSVTVKAKEIWQIAQNKLQQLKDEPLWLKGYLGQATAETLGSLIALVDGRNVPLTVGYHKVLVEIRDQIARTTIEESFVNRTNTELKGEFYFPLPQDASISGFGMWIGDKLVEADVVEKQRAREIFEQILREKRDPGLLEWTGGNIFKASVYPIPAHGEKRIKITYTQVLPLVGDSYRYSYALQSDLLKQNPLRQLDIAVNIQSTQPLQQVISPTHPTRNPLEKSSHANHLARLEFSAQDYTPTRDFEVVATLATRNQDLTLIPTQRGDDGYFMLLMQPPNHTGQWKRPLVNDGQPLELLILADTSASMDKSSRTRQGEVIAALLGSLAPKDKFNLAVCDVDCIWAMEKSSEATPESIAKARDMLDKRRSLGWTNLQRGWESALQKAGDGAHIIYLGDGVITRGTLDIAGDTQAIASAAKGKNVIGHAIAVSSSYESQVLKALAAVGGGSLRQSGGEVKPAQVAHDFLVEATRPALRNMKVTFNGFRTAAVYPPTLANLPAGTQQVILGRYLPDSAEKKAEVIIIGTLDGKPVSYRADVDLKQAPKAGSDDDASFIPRLWARAHLDELLSQGSSQQTQEQIIAMSEEYHIITPYTSLLVLETDADRERFKVKKRVQIRDAERFFQKSNDDLRFALIQQQLEQAQAWRQQLRQQLLQSLSTLGRDANLLQARVREELSKSLSEPTLYNFSRHGHYLGDANHLSMSLGRLSASSGGGGAGGAFGNQWNEGWLDSDGDALTVLADDFSEADEKGYFNGRFGRPVKLGVALSGLRGVGDRAFTGEELFDVEYEFSARDGEKQSATHLWAATNGLGMIDAQSDFLDAGGKLNINVFNSDGLMLGEAKNEFESNGGEYFSYAGRGLQWGFDGPVRYKRAQRGYGYVAPARQSLLPTPPPFHVSQRKPRERKTSWPAEAVTLLRSLELDADLRKLAGGVLVDRQEDSFNIRTAALSSRRQTRQLYSPAAWLTRGDLQRDDSPLLQWCDKSERGNHSLAFGVSLVRKSDDADLQFLPDLLNDTHRWDQTLHDYDVKIERPAPNRVLIIAKASEDVLAGYEEQRWLIDTELRLVIESERRYQDKLVDRTVYSKFVQIGERFVATTAENFDAKGKRTSLSTLQVKELAAADFKTAWDSEQKARTTAVTLQLPLPKLADAEKHIAAGQAKIEDRITLLGRQYGRNQWNEAAKELEAAEKLAPGKPGWDWIRLVLLWESRRHAEAKDWLLTAAEKTVAARPATEFAIVQRLRHVSLQLTGGNEQLELLAALQPAYLRFAAPRNGEKEYQLARLDSLSTAGRNDEYRDLLLQLTKKYPSDASLQQFHVGQLRQNGDIAAALAWIEAALASDVDWQEHEADNFRSLYCDILESEGRYADAAKFARTWIEKNPNTQNGHDRLLAYLVLSGQEPQAFALAETWLKENVPAVGQPLKYPAFLKVYSAVQLLLGQGRNISQATLNAKYLPQLEKLLLQFVGSNDAHSIALQIWNENDFRSSPARERVQLAIFARLQENIGTLPVDQVQRLFDIAPWNGNIPNLLGSWERIQSELERRWAVEKKIRPRAKYRELILRITDIRGTNEREQALRKFLAGALPREKDQATLDLFNFLMIQSWTAEREAETLKLLDQLGQSEPPNARLHTRVQALYRWTDTLEGLRGSYLINKIDHPDKWKREALDKEHEKLRKQAREEISQRLATAANAHQNDPLARWFLLEHLTLEIRLERKLPQVSDQLWSQLQQSLDRQPATEPKDDDAAAEDDVAQALEDVWQHRLLKSLLHLAARKDAPAGESNRLIKLFEAEQKLRQDRQADPTPAEKRVEKRAANRLDWQQLHYELLLARDRPAELQQLLTGFVALGDETGRWRRQLARVYAELNKLEAGVQVFEDLQRADLLGSEDYRALATWYHALDQRAKHEAAQVRVYRFQNPWQLNQLLTRQLQRWQTRGPAPEKLDPNVLLMFAALLKAEDNPSYFLSNTLLQFYTATHDPRLLQSIAQALPGHTAERVYPMLSQCWQVLLQVEHEATIDELIEGLAEVRKSVKTPLDQRTLDLLESLAHRRAAELKNGAQPHLQAALAALQRAEKRDWQTGEPLQMVEYLASLGVISQPLLAAEQVRLLGELVQREKPGTEAHLRMSAAFANTEWGYERKDRAIQLLTTACEQYREAQGGKVTQGALDHWFRIVEWQAQRSQFVTAERTLDTLQTQVANNLLAQRVIHRRFGLYATAIRSKGLTSFGRGEDQYRAALAASREEARKQPELNFLVELANQTIGVIEAAHDVQIAAAPQDMIAYANDDFAKILSRQVNNYDNSVERMAQSLNRVAGPKPAIAFLLDRSDSEPIWVRYQGTNTWDRHAYRLAEWRTRVKELKQDLGELEPRLLKFVIKELKRDLAERSSRNRYMYYRHQWFWDEKAGDFAAAAEEVLKTYRDNNHVVAYIAEYFYYGLDRPDRGLEILLDAHERKLLDESQQIRLVYLLHEAKRYAESIPILEPLVKRHPLVLTRRCELMKAYFHTKRQQALLDLRQQTHDVFHEGSRWHESVMHELGNACLACELFEPAVEYLKEATAAHLKGTNGKSIGDSTLSAQFQSLAQSYAGLKNTKGAVDAAASAIICWPRQVNERENALHVLRLVMQASPNLKAYVKQLDQETKEQDRPVVRKALGMVFQQEGDFAEAITQYRAAVQLTPNDADLHKKLIECFDARNDKTGAIAQSLDSLELNRRNFELWKKLAQRLDAAMDPAEAERARTSLAEVAPGETEGLTILAQEREQQKRLPEALEQWEQVAKLRKLEPLGLLNMARVQLQLKQKDAAAESLQQLEARTWPQHFRAELDRQLPQLKEQMRK